MQDYSIKQELNKIGTWEKEQMGKFRGTDTSASVCIDKTGSLNLDRPTNIEPFSYSVVGDNGF